MFNRRMKLFALMMSLILSVCFASPEPAHAGMFDSFKEKVSSAVSTAVSAAKSVVDTAKGVVTKAVDTAKSVAGVAIDTTMSIVDNTKKVLEGAYNKTKETVKNVVSSVFGAGKQVVDTAKNAVTSGVDKAVDVVKDLPEEMKDTADKINNGINNVKDFIAGKAKDFKEFATMLKDFKDEKIDMLANAPEELKEKYLHPAIAKLKDNAEKAFDNTKKMALDFAAVAKDAGKSAAKGVDFAKDNLEKIMKENKNSIQLASAVGGFKSADGNQSGKQSFGMGGINWTTKADIEGHAKGHISADTLAEVSAYLGPRYNAEYNGKFFGDKVALTAKTDNVLGAWGKANGNFKFMKDGALVDAKGKVEVGAGFKSENDAQLTTKIGGGYGTKTSLHAEVMAGAQARANGTVYAGKNGLELSGKAEARCGAWVEGNLNHAVQYKGNDLFGVGVGGGAGAGVGAGVQGGVSFKANKIGFQNLGFTLGPVKVNATFYVNPVGMAEMAVDKGKQAVKAVADKGKEVIDGAKDGLKKVGSFLNPFD